MRRVRRRFISDRQAQMMLLTAFVLVIGFVALAGMVARLNQLPEATRQAGDRPIYTEAAAVSRGVEAALQRINELMAPEDAQDLEDMPAGHDMVSVVEQSLQHMTRLESAQGFRLRINEVSCADTDPGSNVVEITVVYSLADTRTQISFRTSWIVVDPLEDPIETFDEVGDPLRPHWCP